MKMKPVYLLSVLVLCPFEVKAKAKWVVVVSSMRSGTTHLFNRLSQEQKLQPMYELFNDGLDQNNNFAKIMLSEDEFRNRRNFPIETMEKIHNHLKNKNKSIPVIKVFQGHIPSEIKLKELIGHKDSLVVILDRSPMRRKCSLDHAYRTSDWQAKHTKDAFNRSFCNMIAMDPDNLKFTKRHVKWILMGLEYSRTAYGSVYLDFYDLYIRDNHENTLSRLFHIIDSATEARTPTPSARGIKF